MRTRTRDSVVPLDMRFPHRNPTRTYARTNLYPCLFITLERHHHHHHTILPYSVFVFVKPCFVRAVLLYSAFFFCFVLFWVGKGVRSTRACNLES
jgi:hypothetical protein